MVHRTNGDGTVWIIYYINQHKRLRNFFAENWFIIGLKSMVFRMSFSMRTPTHNLAQIRQLKSTAASQINNIIATQYYCVNNTILLQINNIIRNNIWLIFALQHVFLCLNNDFVESTNKSIGLTLLTAHILIPVGGCVGTPVHCLAPGQQCC